MPTALRRISAMFLAFLPLIVVFTMVDLNPARPVQAFVPESQQGGAGLNLYLPLLLRAQGPSARLESMWATDLTGSPQLAYLPGDGLVYQLTGTTLLSETITATLQLSQAGPCGATLIYSDTLALPPGSWQESVPASAPDCTGIYTNTFQLEHESFSTSLDAQIVVRPLIQATYSNWQGFDRCFPPSVSDMQSWWNESPYSTFNIYLGGIHFFCSQNPMDAIWVHQVAEQGWTFTATWVGPQAPCSSFTHKISANSGQAYQEGEIEALAAVDAARQLGLFGDLTIHYDVEGYFGDDACAAAVQSFMQGWTDQLHNLGYDAGGYGGACSSLISDWWNNNPPIDQVWIAHWTDSGYNPNASVWNAPCVSNSLWPNQQRFKQYAGDHVETWDGISMGVDSNVFDTTVLDSAAGQAPSRQPIAGFSPVGDRDGWLLLGSSLHWTDDHGQSWQEISPPGFAVLGAAFLNERKGWVAGWSQEGDGLSLGHTLDGGATWHVRPLEPAGPLSGLPVAGAYFELLDGSHLWLALGLGSGSSFSLGQLYASQDGGANWESRSLPLGEPVTFRDSENGWISGGPAGSQVFRTTDGGHSWTPVNLPGLPVGEIALGPPLFGGGEDVRMAAARRLDGRLVVIEYRSRDLGVSWQPGEPVPFSGDLFPGSLAALPMPELENSGFVSNLPSGVVRLEFANELHGWALSQSGSCGEEKGIACRQSWALWWTADGGSVWTPLPAPDLAQP